jgi:hypothetical protein
VVASGKHWQAARLLGLTTARLPTVDGQPSWESAFPPATDGRHAHASEAEPAAEPIERYVRGEDLVLGYETSQRRATHVDALWRIVKPLPGEKFMVGVDLIVSVRTQLADAWPELAVESMLSRSETLRVDQAKPSRSRSLSPTPPMTFTLESDKGAGCLLFRPTGFPLSYVEMVHPADFCCDQWMPKAAEDDGPRLIHRLFRSALEKGVLLRGRVRGVFVPRIDDTRLAAECYADFAAADPPLGT